MRQGAHNTHTTQRNARMHSSARNKGRHAATHATEAHNTQQSKAHTYTHTCSDGAVSNSSNSIIANLCLPTRWASSATSATRGGATATPPPPPPPPPLPPALLLLLLLLLAPAISLPLSCSSRAESDKAAGASCTCSVQQGGREGGVRVWDGSAAAVAVLLLRLTYLA